MPHYPRGIVNFDSKRVGALALVLGTLGVLLSTNVGCSASGNRFPRDAELLRTFSDHRQAFDRLRQMVAEDAKRQGPIFTEKSLRDDLPSSRRQEYRTHLASIHPGLVVTFDYDAIVRFIFAATGTSAIGSGSLKGIEFVPSGARSGATIAKSLDDVEKLDEGIYLRPIEAGWYLLFQKTL